ncbi:MAG: FAD-dependent thymidylate synthase [Oscillospiraceae bacterium]|nr:FAD-dependent thymidylate synthase [Oscillospiraceae bacterium]
MAEKTLRVTLIRATAEADALAALGARACYSADDLEALQARVAGEDQAGFLDRVMHSGHASVAEHAVFTFGVEGVSRVLLAQLTRHRIASFSVQSQRYVALDGAVGFDYVVPPAIAGLGSQAVQDYHSQMAQMNAWYAAWRQRLGGAGEAANEDARFVLPGACCTRLLLTMNARELLHFFALRCCSRAQWEIRALARQMLRLAFAAAPALFAQAGPGCVASGCPEGAKTCGQAARVREDIARLKTGRMDGETE